MKNFITLSCFCIVSVLSAGCSSSAGDEGSNDTALSRIPKATQPVSVVSTSSSATKARILAAASTGLPLATAASNSFGGSYSAFIAAADVGTKVKSYGSCEALNYTRGALAQAAQADLLSCILGSVIPEAQVADFADGDYHIVSMTASMDGASIVYKVKMRASLNSAGEVASFEMLACEGGTQTTYLTQAIADGVLTMSTKGVATPGNPDVTNVVYATSVAGTVDSANRFTGTKTINLRYQNTFASGSFNHSVSTLTQTATGVVYNGYSCEKDTANGACESNSQSLLFSSELINGNTDAYEFDLNKLALGHGAYTLSSAGSVYGWDGDAQGTTDATSTSEASRTSVASLQSSIPAISSTFEAVSFAEAETWDCSGDAELTIPSLSFSGGTCSGLFLDQDVHLACSGQTP